MGMIGFDTESLLFFVPEELQLTLETGWKSTTAKNIVTKIKAAFSMPVLATVAA